ncbi:PREDICTED: uncharacterized protein LOC106323735 [Brassica oleracea var. oleracea]|uniref:uncharacterized protein LOC106323735 n=1 Tax=Brassica oleracea var. oleracea TaxID=109376 RepID=UPI0006A71B1D|nr:PREDICTED: uncharacterized protein LOC106323735 [Brassica oleracea var. oleracea]
MIVSRDSFGRKPMKLVLQAIQYYNFKRPQTDRKDRRDGSSGHSLLLPVPVQSSSGTIVSSLPHFRSIILRSQSSSREALCGIVCLLLFVFPQLAPKGKFIAFVLTDAETDNPQTELKPGIDPLGQVDELFFEIYDRYEPVNKPTLDNCCISTSYDATTHIDTTVVDVLNMYKLITGKVMLQILTNICLIFSLTPHLMRAVSVSFLRQNICFCLFKHKISLISSCSWFSSVCFFLKTKMFGVSYIRMLLSLNNPRLNLSLVTFIVASVFFKT